MGSDVLRRLSRASALAPAILVCLAMGCSSSSEAPATASTGCLHNSDCAGDLRCLFRSCKTQCSTDAECPSSSRCLFTATGSGCVAGDEASCVNGCPAGTTCGNDESCRTTCDASGQGGSSATCLSDQTCSATHCVGKDPGHDPTGASVH